MKHETLKITIYGKKKSFKKIINNKIIIIINMKLL